MRRCAVAVTKKGESTYMLVARTIHTQLEGRHRIIALPLDDKTDDRMEDGCGVEKKSGGYVITSTGVSGD